MDLFIILIVNDACCGESDVLQEVQLSRATRLKIDKVERVSAQVQTLEHLLGGILTHTLYYGLLATTWLELDGL